MPAHDDEWQHKPAAFLCANMHLYESREDFAIQRRKSRIIF